MSNEYKEWKKKGLWKLRMIFIKLQKFLKMDIMIIQKIK